MSDKPASKYTPLWGKGRTKKEKHGRENRLYNYTLHPPVYVYV